MCIRDSYTTVEMVFSDIENAVREGRVCAGVIIHENRFTYVERGFHKIIDLGNYWETKTQLPIPLGGIAIKRSLDDKIKQQVLADLKSSINLADRHFDQISDYITLHSQEMDVQVMQQHIDLYVNGSTRGLSDTDISAIDYLITVIRGKTDQTEDINKNWLFEGD